MNPWDWVLPILGWFFLAMIVVGAARGIRKWFGPKPSMTREQFNLEKSGIIRSMDRDHQLPVQPRDAFSAGAVWAWGTLHRK